ncbi:MAG TPA: hypothetical protein VKS01_04275 [Bryobacteraceae bacterium]|nr:hypothetical protein [Bryobacteraceae bacterium]
MPFCPQCGNQVGATDVFCAKCGGKQPGASAGAGPAPGLHHDFAPGISNRQAALLCYIPLVGWIAAIIVLAAERFRHQRDVRFHAFQGLYLFVAWLIVDWVLSPARFMFYEDRGYTVLVHLMELGLIAAWIFMMIKVSQDQTYKLPIIGELAERSVSEQTT